MTRALGNDLVGRALVNIMISDVTQFVNVGKTMSDAQVIETVGLIMKHYSHLKPEDFKLCFDGIKTGKYGQLYDRFDGQIILHCLNVYDQERDFVAAEINSNQNEAFKMYSMQPLLPERIDADDTRYDELFKTNIAILRARLAKHKEEREKAKAAQKKPIDNPIATIHQNWLQQFSDLHMIQQLPGKARMIRKYGLMKNPFANKLPKMIPRILDINAYLEHKQWQYILAQLCKNERMNEYLTKYPKKSC
ncbi:hypothetical protein [Mucilaginibacter sp. L196]|uniref:hypothetical protein n=1 Tax=Mucilaginibacter sp. L196 TaxID=1641870 RepID=UPI00131C65C7|nr:hypothetical protein [Mucilaginibacter sp. L196]